MNSLKVAAKYLKEVLDFQPLRPLKAMDRTFVTHPDGQGYVLSSSDPVPAGFQSKPCKIIDFPSMRQTYTYSCGSMAVTTLMQFYGFDVREDKAMKELGTDQYRGTPFKNIVKYFEKHGFEVFSGPSTIPQVKQWIDKGIPVLVDLQAYPDDKKEGWEKSYVNGHYVTVIGYTDDHIIFSDPSVVYDDYLTNEEFMKRWHDSDSKGEVYDNHVIVPQGNTPVYEHNRILPLEA